MSENKNPIFNGGAVIGSLLPTGVFFPWLITILGIAVLIVTTIAGICVWFCLAELAKAAQPVITKNQILLFLLIDLTCSVGIGFAYFFSTKGSGNGLARKLPAAILIAQLICLVANAVIMLAMNLGLRFESMSFSSRFLSVTVNCIICLLLAIWPAISAVLFDVAVMIVSSLFKSIRRG